MTITQHEFDRKIAEARDAVARSERASGNETEGRELRYAVGLTLDLLGHVSTARAANPQHDVPTD